MGDIDRQIGELTGLMQAVRDDVSELKETVKTLKSAQDQQKGGGKVLVTLGAVVGAAASMAVEAFKR